MRAVRPTIALVVAALALLAVPAVAAAQTETASSGMVVAQLSYSGGPTTTFTNLRLSISRAGTVVYDQPVSAPGCGTLCQPANQGAEPSVRVLELDTSGEPEVLVDLYSGGAHCCSISQLFSWNAPTSSYVHVTRNWGDPGYALLDLRHDGRLEFRSADDRFAYEFAPFAYSGLPLQIWRFQQGRFRDVTASFRGLVARDARLWLRIYRGSARQGLGLGALAAWAADEERLGHRRTVDRELAADLRRHQLGSLSGWPSGRRYINALRRFLRHTGYLR